MSFWPRLHGALAGRAAGRAALLLLLLLCASACGTDEKDEAVRLQGVVVLGSSTAFGVGPKDHDNSWVERYRRHLADVAPDASLSNLSFPGYTTYQIQPTGFVPPADRPGPDEGKNISVALAARPAAIIVNLPSNDQSKGYSQQDQLDNFDRVVAAASSSKTSVWITTTQPRNFKQDADRAALAKMRESIQQRYAPKVIDFWSPIVGSDNRLLPEYDSGDGVHLNDEGHAVLFQAARDASIVK